MAVQLGLCRYWSEAPFSSDAAHMSHSTKMKEFVREKKQKNNTAYFDSFSFKTQL